MKKRITSAGILLVVFIPFLILGGLPFAMLMAVLSVLSLYELLTTRHKIRRIPAAIELYSYILVLFFTLNNYNVADVFYMLDYKLMAFLVLINLSPLVNII